MRFLVLLLLCSLFVTKSTAQVRQQAGKLNANFGPGGIVQTKEYVSTGPIGEHHYASSWYKASIESVNKKSIGNQEIKYNLKDQSLIIKLDQKQVKIIHSRFIQSFSLIDSVGDIHQFENAKDYSLEGTPLVGFLETLHKGKFSLFFRHSLSIKQAYYVPTHDVGSQDPEYIKNIELYACSNGKELVLIKNKKMLLTLFPNHVNEMKVYQKKHKVKLKDYHAIKKMMSYYLTLK